jgi:hypothetical protein
MADAVRRRRRCRHAPRHTERSLTTKFESDPWPGFSASSFMKHSILRIDQTPEIEIHVIKSWEAPVGIGETGAMAGPLHVSGGRENFGARPYNRATQSHYAATGVPLRRVPVDRAPARGGEEMMKPATRRILLGVVAVVVIAAA